MTDVEETRPASTAGSPAVRGVRPALATVLVGAFMATLDSFIVIVAGPAIQAGLGASPAELQWVLAGYQLTFAVLLVTGGRLGDLFGRRRLFLTGTALFTLASVACAAAPSPGVLIAARLVQGLGAAAMVPQVFAAIVVLVPERDRPRAFGALGVALGLATVGGQLLGGLLVGADLLGSGWRAVFWINVPIGAATVLLAARYLPESRAALARRLDLPGVLALTVALFGLVLPLIGSGDAGRPAWTWVSLGASLVAFAAFVGIEARTARRGGDPLLRLSLFRSRSFSVGLLLVLAVYAVISSYYLVLSVALQEGRGMSALAAGLVYAPAGVTFLVVSVVAGRLVPRYGRRVLEAGAVVVALGYAATIAVLTARLPFTPAVVVPTLVLQSVGGGLLITPSLGAVLARIDPAEAGIASGVLSTAQQVGAALGVAVVGAVFFRSFRPAGGADPAAHALVAASVATLVIAVAALVLVRLLPRDDRSGAAR